MQQSVCCSEKNPVSESMVWQITILSICETRSDYYFTRRRTFCIFQENW